MLGPARQVPMARVGEALNVLRELLVNVFQAANKTSRRFLLQEQAAPLIALSKQEVALILNLLFKIIKPFAEAR